MAVFHLRRSGLDRVVFQRVICIFRSVQNVHQAKQVAKQAKVRKLPDVQNAMPENTPKIQVKRDAKTAQQVLRPKALRIAAHAQPDLF